MKIIETDLNVTFAELVAGDVFKAKDCGTNKDVFMKVLPETILVECDGCDDTFDCYFTDHLNAINLATGEMGFISPFDKVVKYDATLTISK
jgi:hypothetical protein